MHDLHFASQRYFGKGLGNAGSIPVYVVKPLQARGSREPGRYLILPCAREAGPLLERNTWELIGAKKPLGVEARFVVHGENKIGVVEIDIGSRVSLDRDLTRRLEFRLGAG